ncbi:YraN family protein [Paenibacillus rhizoplanae]
MSHNGDGRTYTRQEKGAAAEQAARMYLTSRGYLIRDHNWRCRSGELDIIAEYEGALVFIEVRSRSGSAMQGTAEESVDARKNPSGERDSPGLPAYAGASAGGSLLRCDCCTASTGFEHRLPASYPGSLLAISACRNRVGFNNYP